MPQLAMPPNVARRSSRGEHFNAFSGPASGVAV